MQAWGFSYFSIRFAPNAHARHVPIGSARQRNKVALILDVDPGRLKHLRVIRVYQIIANIGMRQQVSITRHSFRCGEKPFRRRLCKLWQRGREPPIKTLQKRPTGRRIISRWPDLPEAEADHTNNLKHWTTGSQHADAIQRNVTAT